MRAALLVPMLAACLLALPAHAQQRYPTKAVKVIVPTPVGGPGDIIARGTAATLSQMYGQPFVVENRLGVGSIVGAEACSKSAPDGYTLCVMDSFTITLNPFTYSKLPYDPAKDFAPIVHYGYLASSLSVHPSLPVKTFDELLNLARSKPNQIAWGSFGASSTPHFYIEWLRKTRDVHFLEIPYKAASEAMQRMIAGDVQVVSFSQGQSAAMHKAGKIRIIAIPGSVRSPLLPEIPTFKEVGMDLTMNTWFGLYAPAGTPQEIVRRINGDLGKLIPAGEFKDKFLTTQGVQTDSPAGGSPEAFAAWIREETEMYAKLVKTVGAKPQD
jgi:tripartite-type tricarboxylate transporter receptor subunit TctC